MNSCLNLLFIINIVHDIYYLLGKESIVEYFRISNNINNLNILSI